MTFLVNEPSEANSAIVKADTRGRVLLPADRRDKLLEEYEKSGLSAAKFAALVGLKYSTFAAWVARRKRARELSRTPAKADATQEPVRWLEAVVEEARGTGAVAGPALMLQLPGGVRALVSDGRQIGLAAALVRALEKTSC
jgi:hypothetical protein